MPLTPGEIEWRTAAIKRLSKSIKINLDDRDITQVLAITSTMTRPEIDYMFECFKSVRAMPTPANVKAHIEALRYLCECDMNHKMQKFRGHIPTIFIFSEKNQTNGNDRRERMFYGMKRYFANMRPKTNGANT